MAESLLEKIAAQLIKDSKLPTPIREFKICKDRKWRGDYLFLTGPNPPKAKPGERQLLPDRLVLVEIMGGIWNRGKHVRPLGYIQDCEKANWAAVNGYTVLRVTKEHLASGQAVEWVRQALYGPELPEN